MSDSLEPAVRVFDESGVALSLDPAVPASDCLDVLFPAEGSAGGPIDVLLFVVVVFEPPASEALLVDDSGVLVRDGAKEETAEPSCFVGDFVGDCRTSELQYSSYQRQLYDYSPADLLQL